MDARHRNHYFNLVLHKAYLREPRFDNVFAASAPQLVLLRLLGQGGQAAISILRESAVSHVNALGSALAPSYASLVHIRELQ